MSDESKKKTERIAVANPSAPGTEWERVLERQIAEPIPEDQFRSAVASWATQRRLEGEHAAKARELGHLDRRIGEPAPIPEDQLRSAVDFWAAQLVIADKREPFARELAAAIRTSPTPTHLNLEVDYDPDEMLHAVLDTIGVTCRGWGDSAAGIFARRKVRMWIRDGYTRVAEGYGAPYRILWGTKPDDD